MPLHILYLSGFTAALSALFTVNVFPTASESSTYLLQAAFWISFWGSSLVAGKLLNNCDIKRSITWAMLVLGLSSVLLEMAFSVAPTSTHVILWTLIRLVKGLWAGFIKTASLSLIGTMYLNKATMMLIIYEVLFSAGALLGRTLTSSSTTQVHQARIVYLICIITIVVSLALGYNKPIVITNQCENDYSTKSISYIQSNTSGVYHVASKPLTYSEVLASKQCLLNVFATFVVYLQFGYVLARFTEKSEGSDILILTVVKFWILAVLLVVICKGAHSLTKNYEDHNLLVSSMVCLALTQCIFGPMLLNSENSVLKFTSYLMSTGFLAIFLVTILPHIVRILVETSPAKTPEATCVSVGIYNAIASGAQAFSILVGCIVANNLGPKAYWLTLGWILVIFCLIFYFSTTKLRSKNSKYENLVRSFQLNCEVEESGHPWEESCVSCDGSFLHKI